MMPRRFHEESWIAEGRLDRAPRRALIATVAPTEPSTIPSAVGAGRYMDPSVHRQFSGKRQ